MLFDDRLATVLRLRAQGPALARIQYRQLLDLLGTLPVEARSPAIDDAYDRLGELADELPLDARIAALRDGSMRLRSPRLIAELASGDPALAEAVIDRAQLGPAEWADLLPALPPAARARLGTRADLAPDLVDRLARLGVGRLGLPAATPLELTVDDELPDAPIASGPDSIGALVKRIEAYRKARVTPEPGASGEAPRLPLGEDHFLAVPSEAQAFDFSTDAVGTIAWADPGVAPMVVGQALSAVHGGKALRGRLRAYQPIEALRLKLRGSEAIAGDWRVDASPRFDPLTGRFLGYHGRMRRWPGSKAADGPHPGGEADRIRQLLHELRTPVNAIQGFAELIQQQLFGPVPHEYRAQAAGIAADAARMLAAFEELERLARLDSGAMQLETGGCDLAAVVASTAAQLEAHTGPRGSGFISSGLGEAHMVGLARSEAERIAWRLLATLAGVAAPGERLALDMTEDQADAVLAIQLPKALAGRSDKELYATAPGAVPQVLAAGVFGIGFALRLVRAEARGAGGRLDRTDDRLLLHLPGLTGANEGHSQAG
jgi:two-component system OmpR family sensor kinase